MTQLIYTVFLTDVDGPVRGETLGLPEEFGLLILLANGVVNTSSCRCHHFFSRSEVCYEWFS